MADMPGAFKREVPGAEPAERDAAIQPVTVINAARHWIQEAVGFGFPSTDSWAHRR